MKGITIRVVCCSTLAIATALSSASAQTAPSAPAAQPIAPTAVPGSVDDHAPGSQSTSTQGVAPAAVPDGMQPTDDAKIAAAPAAGTASASEQDIVVTGSRVVTNGYTAPTPVTVVGPEELKNTAPSLTEALRLLPQLTGSSSASTPSATPGGGGSSTADTPNLRNLGATRTLVLLDGRRPPASGLSGTADTGLFPLLLVKRVDIVTGGASAAYGSDAVAGVVNYVLDTKFRGVSAEVRDGISTHGDGHSYNGQIAAGFGFAGDRGSLILNVSGGQQDPIEGYDRDWAQSYYATIPNPQAAQAGQPQLLLRPNVNLSAATFGGLIITPGALRDTAFDANGSPIPYRHGTLNSGSLEVGGDGAHYPRPLVSDVSNHTGFAHGQFDVSSKFSVFAEGGYGYSKSSYANLFPFDLAAGAYVIQRDNAYLPASIRQTMIASNLNSIQLAKIDESFGRNIVNNISKTYNGTVGFNASLGRFSIDGYYEHGETRFRIQQTNQRITANARAALDAVVNPATGQIVCRSTLTNPTNGCVPWNPFGTQPLTAAQRAYQQGTGELLAISKQDVASLAVRGKLFEGWAGPISAAVGGEYRKQSGIITVDPISAATGFSNGNPQASGGGYNVKEAFGEIAVPLVRGTTFIKSLDLNGAVRRTDYSTSGSVTTWKAGLSSEVVDGLLLRGTLSRDIRAPNIGDLYGPRTRAALSVRDPQNGNRVYNNIITITGSNPALLPERARTFTAGVAYRPPFLPGFGASIDYYRIRINDAISTLTSQNIVDRCAAGDTTLCDLITRNAANEITQISGFGLNIQTVKIAGTDVDVSFRSKIGAGTVTLRGIATYLSDYQSVAPGTTPIKLVGTTVYPRLRGNLQMTYNQGGTTLSVQERLVGSHKRVVLPTTVDDNHVPKTFYTNATIRHQFDAGSVKPELFLTVNNLFDQKPRVNETNSLTIGTSVVTDNALYDVIGRYVTVGARVRF